MLKDNERIVALEGMDQFESELTRYKKVLNGVSRNQIFLKGNENVPNWYKYNMSKRK